MARNNPNGANQYQVDPRQALFLANYLNPKSKTFSNAYQSALEAGYTEEYAANILNQDTDWLSESLESNKMVQKAEKVLEKALEIDVTDEKIGDRALKASQFVTSRLNKAKWSERIEATGANGKDLPVPIIQLKPQE